MHLHSVGNRPLHLTAPLNRPKAPVEVSQDSLPFYLKMGITTTPRSGLTQELEQSLQYDASLRIENLQAFDSCSNWDNYQSDAGTTFRQACDFVLWSRKLLAGSQHSRCISWRQSMVSATNILVCKECIAICNQGFRMQVYGLRKSHLWARRLWDSISGSRSNLAQLR